MKKEFDPARLDVARFAKEGGALEGQETLATFDRLAAEVREDGKAAPLHWRAQGEMLNPSHLRPQVWLHLQAGTTLALVCQRCLGPMELPVEVDRSFRFVEDEATAAAEDDASEEDVLALSRSFDLRELVEDELLMAVPPAPRHEACPAEVHMAVADPEFEAAQAQRKKPFAVLATLKSDKR